MSGATQMGINFSQYCDTVSLWADAARINFPSRTGAATNQSSIFIYFEWISTSGVYVKANLVEWHIRIWVVIGCCLPDAEESQDTGATSGSPEADAHSTAILSGF